MHILRLICGLPFYAVGFIFMVTAFIVMGEDNYLLRPKDDEADL